MSKNLQFEVVKEHYDGKWTKTDSFTTDSFKDAIVMAYQNQTHKIYDYIHIVVYEADGTSVVCDLNEAYIITLHMLRQYLK